MAAYQPPTGEPDRPRGEIWIGDVARAVAALSVDPADKAVLSRIANLLGMETAASVRPPSRSGSSEPRPRPRTVPSAPRSSPTPPAQEDPRQRRRDGLAVPLLQPLSAWDSVPRVWSEPALAGPSSRAIGERPALQGLLPPHSEAATLRLLVSRLVAEGPVDIERLLGLMGTATVVTELPRQPVRTVRFGVQVLVDLGEGMEPFLRDAMRVLERAAAISGRHGCDVLYFADCPLHRSGPGAAWTWGSYHPPATGTRVLVLSDFGLHLDAAGRLPPRYEEDWRHTAGLIRHNGCSPVALVPAPLDRWPRWLTDLMPALCWDRTTTAAVARSRLP
ncbi:hypothetical protein [Streptomyces mirabilis]|uniref:hypothetical protein n=1 Tax=Streptomyces mirabilis TaxID=68239 RepID=UPI003322D7DA